MHHYNAVLSLQITICNDSDGKHNNGATIQSCSDSWVWLIIIFVIVSCTDLFLYFLYQFSNFIQLVPILFTPVELCTLLIFCKFLCLVSLLFHCSLDYYMYNCLHLLYSMQFVQCTHGMMVFVKK